MNKVATKAELRFDVMGCAALNQGQRQRLKALLPGSINRRGELVLFSDETRSQQSNLELLRDRLRRALLEVRTPPKKRRPTRPTRASKARRLDAKRRRADIKSTRRRVDS